MVKAVNQQAQQAANEAYLRAKESPEIGALVSNPLYEARPVPLPKPSTGHSGWKWAVGIVGVTAIAAVCFYAVSQHHLKWNGWQHRLQARGGLVNGRYSVAHVRPGEQVTVSAQFRTSDFEPNAFSTVEPLRKNEFVVGYYNDPATPNLIVGDQTFYTKDPFMQNGQHLSFDVRAPDRPGVYPIYWGYGSWFAFEQHAAKFQIATLIVGA